MQTRPSNWSALFAGTHKTEYKLTIDGVDYYSDRITDNPVVSKPLLDKPAIGKVCSATMTVTIRPYPDIVIPKAARCYLYCRLTDGTTTTDWVRQGCFFITSRRGTANLTLNLRDDMIKAGQTFMDKTLLSDFPKSQITVLQDILRIMDVTLDERSDFSKGANGMNQAHYNVTSVSDDTLISEILSWIAASHGGNFIMTEAGRLRLVPLASPKNIEAAEVVLGTDYHSYTSNGEPVTISQVTMTDENDEIYSEGNETGIEIAFDNPVANQYIVQDVYEALNGVRYIPYRIDNAYLNPLAELGDTVIITRRGGERECIVLNAAEIFCGVGYTCTLETDANGGEEDELPYTTVTEAEKNRSIRTYKKYYGVTLNKADGLSIRRIVDEKEEAKVIFNADEMAFYKGNEQVLYFDAKEKTWRMSASMEIEVEGQDGNRTSLNAFAGLIEGTVTDLSTSVSQISQTASEISSRVQSVEGQYSQLTQTVDGFTFSEVNPDGSTTTKIKGGSIQTDDLYLYRLFSRSGNIDNYVEMVNNGLNFVFGRSETIGIGYYNGIGDVMPYIIFGAGSTPNTDTCGMIKRYKNGIWIGNSVDRAKTEITGGTGLFVDTEKNTIYKYYNGIGAALADTSNVTAVFG